MATRKEVNDLYQQYLGRDATKEGLDYWTSQGLSLSGIEYNIANSPEAQAKVSTSITIGDIPVNLGLFTGNVTSPFKFPTDLLRDELTQGKFFQQFIDFFRPYVEGQDVDDPDRINRANEASRWLDLLGKYAEGNATEEDLKNFDAEFLSEIPAWKDYFEGLVGSTDSGTGEDAETRQKADKYANDLNDALGGIVDVQVTSDALYNQFAPGGDMPEPTGPGPTIAVDVWECLGNGGTWDECTTLGVVLQIPGIPQLPSAILGTIFKDVTLKEIKDLILDTGTTIKNVITGECSPENEIEDPVGSGNYRCPTVTDIVLGKISEKADELKDIFDQNCDTYTGENCGITPTDIIKTVGGGISNAVLGAVIAGAEDALRNVVGLPVNITGEDTTCTEGTVYDPDANNGFGGCVQSGTETGFGMCDELDDLGNQVEKIDADGSNCPGLSPTWNPGDACTTGLNPDVENDGTLNEEGKCIPKPSIAPTKQCQDPDVSPDANGRCPEEYCADGSLKFTHPFGICPSDESPDDTTYTKPTVNCKQPKVGFSPSFDPTASAKYAEYSAEYDAACAGGNGDDDDDSTTTDTTYVAPTVDCKQSKVGFDANTFDPTARAKYAEYSESYDATCLSGGVDTGTGDGGEDTCTGGKVLVNGECVCPSGKTEINGECVSVSGGDDTTTGGSTTFNCISQNRKTNEDGSCGECLPGYVLDPDGFDQCVKDDTIITGEPPGPTTETPPPSTSSSGGGGVGGSGGGMFTGTVSGLSYMPQALPGIQTPPNVNAMASLEGLIGRMLTGNIS